MNQRLALLSDILANPEDDLPRLVFADWLEENGTTDADAARVEFIRLGCKSKAKSRMTTVEGNWLDANWRRLLVNTLAVRPKNAKPPTVSREGRFVYVKGRWAEDGSILETRVVFEYVRGFARRVKYLQSLDYQRLWHAAATDEPLAYHSPEVLPSVEGNRMIGLLSRLRATDWGQEVFVRAVCSTEFRPGEAKVYPDLTQCEANKRDFQPLALEDEPDINPGRRRQWAAVATAMTALAREFVGLAVATPKTGADAYQ